MAKRDTPRTMLQNFIDTVPTTAPMKRTRARSRSPTDRLLNVTVPSQNKRRRSSVMVKQTPRSMLVDYMNDQKTKTPFVRALRRRSVPFTPAVHTESPPDKITPRTAMQAFLDNATEETPLQKPVRDVDRTDEEFESHHLPNDTIHIAHSPMVEEYSGPIALSQKERRVTQHHITVQQFSEGLRNRTGLEEEKMFTSDDNEDQSINIPMDTIMVSRESLELEESLESIQRQNQGKRQNRHHITLADLSLKLKNTPRQGTQNKKDEEERPSLLGKKDASPQMLPHSDLTPSKRPMTSDLTPSSRLNTSSKSLHDFNMNKSPLIGQTLLSKSTAAADLLTPTKRFLMRDAGSVNMTPSKSVTDANITSDLTPSRRSRIPTMASTPTRNSSTVPINDAENDLTLSRRSTSFNKSNTVQSRVASPSLAVENGGDLTPSRRSQSRLMEGDNLSVTQRNKTINKTSSNLTENETSGDRVTSDLTGGRTSEDLDGDVDDEYASDVSGESKLVESRLNRSQNQNEPDLSSQKDSSPVKLQNNLSQSRKQSQKAEISRDNLIDTGRSKDRSTPQSNKSLKQTTLTPLGSNTPQSVVKPMKQTTLPVRTPLSSSDKTPLTSNVTILENIKPLSSSTPARTMNEKPISSTPSRVQMRTPLGQSISRSESSTPSRQQASISRATPSRVDLDTPSKRIELKSPLITSTPRRELVQHNTLNRTPGRVLVVKPSSNKSSATTSEKQSRTKSRIQEEISQEIPENPVENESEEDEYEEDTIEIYKLKTPHLKENISRIPTPIYSSTPAPAKSTVKTQKPEGKKKAGGKIGNKQMSTILPNSVIKQAFQHYCNMKVASDTIGELIEFTDTYFENTFKSLEAFALHAGRKTIDESDVELLMKRQGFITDKTPLNVLVENHLPLELREELIPIARANSKVTPL